MSSDGCDSIKWSRLYTKVLFWFYGPLISNNKIEYGSINNFVALSSNHKVAPRTHIFCEVANEFKIKRFLTLYPHSFFDCLGALCRILFFRTAHKLTIGFNSGLQDDQYMHLMARFSLYDTENLDL